MDSGGMEILHSAPYINAQKGFIERARQIIIEIARSMRITARMLEKLWLQLF
jgi:hypothetical protein